MKKLFLNLVIFTSLVLEASSVTVYVSQDQVFSEPILKDFERETGIEVNAIYDSEESKSTGIMNRLLAEKNNPHADVYWANEPIRAEVLKLKGVLAPYKSVNSDGIANVFKEKNNYWCGFSARIRLFIVHKDAVDKPTSIFDYTDEKLAKKAVIANPLFGTTTTHISALFTVSKDADKFLQKLKKNKVAISTSNGESADFVASKKYDFALVDSDDAMSRLKQSKDVEVIYPDQEEGALGVFVVPNAVMLIKKAPHLDNAKKLIDYLLSKETERKLAYAQCEQIPLHEGVKTPNNLKPIKELKVMDVDYEEVAKKLIEIQPYLRGWINQ